MDTTRYSKWGGSSEEIPGGHWGRWVHWSRRPLFLALAILVATDLWAVILSILLSKASTERAKLLGYQDLLRTNASKQTAALGALKEEVGVCRSCCSRTQTQLQTTRAELGEAQAKLMEQESALRELLERVTQGLAEAGGDREDVRPGLFLALEAVRLQNSSCEPCPTSWLPFGSSCYYFSVRKTTWAEVQGHCADARGGDFLSHHTSALEYWIGRKAVQHLCDSQQHPPFNCCNHWLQGEHSECWGCEACVMILGMGLWMDPPCDEKAGRICEKSVCNCLLQR
uniref:C-type lectin domain-containing protein n=1 Tax=Piliocolobus tephrosceles TaxID=591936 RepID=A0A8C9IC38_9PRIM